MTWPELVDLEQGPGFDEARDLSGGEKAPVLMITTYCFPGASEAELHT